MRIKKTMFQQIPEAMQKTMEERSKNQALKGQGDDVPTNNANHVTGSSSIEQGLKSGEINSIYEIESDRGLHRSPTIKKSLSLGSGLNGKGSPAAGNDSEDETDIGYSCDGSHDHDRITVPVGGKHPEIRLDKQYQEDMLSDSVQVGSDLVHNDSIFSIGEMQQLEKEGHGNSDIHLSGEYSDHTPRNPPIIVKSNSLPNLGSSGGQSALKYLAPNSRSSEDLIVLDLSRKEMVIRMLGPGGIHNHERDDTISNNENNCENLVRDGSNSHNYVGYSKDWIVPIMDEVNAEKHLNGEPSNSQWEELPSKDFKIKRIEEWVIDLQHCSPMEELNDGLSNVDDHQVQRDATVVDNLTAGKFDGKLAPGMEAAKKYISSLSATATTAQLANHGLVVIPFLSPFISLRTLNLSGNSIVRITAGALPRGLHTLNLSKNNISTIEGLRELTRLRVLDLSYNRLMRIGHGLASCSSLKELYLAGNKISEVEGLHRLLKLNILDLRFNKISTAKCLGQLAANYNSLQAISLEGNPAQKNVGDEQLKKYLQGLLPHLASFNRQSIKSGSLKDAADRSARLSITSDRSFRSDHKTLRKGSHGGSSQKTSSIHGRRSQAVVSPKRSKGRNLRLPPPPTGTKTATNHRHNFNDFSSKLLGIKSDVFMRRSRSEGTLAAL